MPPTSLQLGLGLIGIGKPWGHVPGEVPSESENLRLLSAAFEAGIRYFDSAPSYGIAEARFGKFLRGLGPAERASLTVATKFGEHWDAARSEPYVDHSYSALATSLERSLETLGAIDVLQLHKTTPEVLMSDDLARAWELARSFGIRVFGPSVSDPESGRLACESGQYQMLQCPLNSSNGRFAGIARLANDSGMYVAANRPFAMGRLFHEPSSRTPHERRVEAFRFLLRLHLRGVILSGTRSPAHLHENIAAFEEARQA